MIDEAYELTEEALKELEKRISDTYAEAYKELNQTVKDYFESFAKRDAEQQKLLEEGKITKTEYQQWRITQLGRGQRYEALRDKIAERMNDASFVAMQYVNDTTPNIWALNRNFTAYEIEKLGYPVMGVEVGGVDYTLYNEQTVKRLIKEQPNLLPTKTVNGKEVIRWNKELVSKSIVSGILQGYSIKDFAEKLQENIPYMNSVSAIRNARTAVTYAQNKGRQDGYENAAKMGIKVLKRWIATKDTRTRHEHAEADGQEVPYDEPFIVGGEELEEPADPAGSPWNIYNCRCSMRTAQDKKFEAEPRMIRVRNPNTGRNEVVKEMTYSEWAEHYGVKEW